MSEPFDIGSDDDDDGPTAPFWMTTFSDMVTLLLTFFVLIVSMSEVQVKKFQEALSHFQGSVSVLDHSAVMQPVRQTDTSDTSDREHAEQYEEVVEYLSQSELSDLVQVELTEDGLRVTLTDSVMFRPGEAALIDPSRAVLRMLAETLGGRAQAIIVEGHTDNRPIENAVFPSNWELSTARAASVVRFLLVQEGALTPDRYIPVGYGEYRPVDTNASSAGRARNRRVEILFSWKPWQNGLTSIRPPKP